MPIVFGHIRHQTKVLAALGHMAVLGMRRPVGGPLPETPTVELLEVVPPRSERLVRDYIRHVGGDPAHYPGELPAHLFPQWGFPLLSKTLLTLPYDLTKVLNGGCSMELRQPIPLGRPLLLRARLEAVDDDGTRAILTQRLVTGVAEAPECLIVEQTAVVLLKKRSGGSGMRVDGTERREGKERGKKRKQKHRVPDEVQELGRVWLGPRAGLEFAFLTGDFNPLHWVGPYARLAGHPTPILHGFSTMARAIEVLNRESLEPSKRHLDRWQARFTRPLRLPADVGIYTDGRGALFVGEAAGKSAYLVGSFEATER